MSTVELALAELQQNLQAGAVLLRGPGMISARGGDV